MSNKRLTAVWDYSKHKGTALLALLSLADRADDDGFCWPSHADTAQRSRVFRSYIVSIMKKLTGSGEVYEHKRPGKTSQYLVLVGQIDSEIELGLKRRFDYDEDKIKEIIKNRRVYKVDTCVSIDSTSHVDSVGHEPLLNPNLNPLVVVGNKPNIFTIYERDIGLIPSNTKVLGELKDADAHYPEEWIDKAFTIGVENNVRKWSYVRAILDNWDKHGFDTKKSKNNGKNQSTREMLAEWEAEEE